MRSFIALELPEHVKANLYHMSETLKNSGIVVGKFVEKDNLHLTLKFLGDIDEPLTEEIIEKLNEVKMKKFEVETGDAGFFPSREYIRIIWIELISKELLELRKDINNKLMKIGFLEEERGFSSHITLARIKSVKNKELFLDELSKLHLKKQKFLVDNFVLMKSELTRKGPVYKIIGNFELR